MAKTCNLASFHNYARPMGKSQVARFDSSARLAHLVEQPPCKRKVRGSRPRMGTKWIVSLRGRQAVLKTVTTPKGWGFDSSDIRQFLPLSGGSSTGTLLECSPGRAPRAPDGPPERGPAPQCGVTVAKWTMRRCGGYAGSIPASWRSTQFPPSASPAL